MPQKKPLTEQEYQAIEDYVASTAPAGLTEDEFYLLVDQTVAERERRQGPGLPPIPMPDTNQMAGTRGAFGTNYPIPADNWTAVKEFGGNVLRSGANVAKNIGSMAQTAGRAITTLGLDPTTGQLDPNLQAFGQTGLSGITQGLKERFGGADALAKTAWEDPVGLGLDLAGPISGAAGAARGAGQSLQRAGVGLMRRAANVPEKVIATSPYAMDDMTIPQTMLQHGINPTTGGRRKLDRIIAPLGEQKGRLVAQSQQTFDPHAPRTTQGLRDFIGEGEIADSTSPQLAPAGQNVLNTFTSGSKYNRPYTPIQQVSARTVQGGPVSQMPINDAPIQLASQDKVQLGRQLSDSAWATNPVDAATEANTLAQRALYGDLQAVEAQIPGVAGVNRQLDPLYATRDHLVKGIGVPEHYVPYPSPGAAFSALLNNSFGAGAGFGARGAYQAGQQLGTLGQATSSSPLMLGGANALGGALTPPEPVGDPQTEAFQRMLQESDPLNQTFGAPMQDWWSPVPRLKP
jgi:hypothetical protein